MKYKYVFYNRQKFNLLHNRYIQIAFLKFPSRSSVEIAAFSRARENNYRSDTRDIPPKNYATFAEENECLC